MSLDASFNYAAILGKLEAVEQLHELAAHPEKVFPENIKDPDALTPEQKDRVYFILMRFLILNDDTFKAATDPAVLQKINKEISDLNELAEWLHPSQKIVPDRITPEAEPSVTSAWNYTFLPDVSKIFPKVTSSDDIDVVHDEMEEVGEKILNHLRENDEGVASVVEEMGTFLEMLLVLFADIRKLHDLGNTEDDFLEKVESNLYFIRLLQRDLAPLHAIFQGNGLQNQVFNNIASQLRVASNGLQVLRSLGRRPTPSHLPSDFRVTPRNSEGGPLPGGEAAKQALYKSLEAYFQEKKTADMVEYVRQSGGMDKAVDVLFQQIETLSQPGQTEADFLSHVVRLRNYAMSMIVALNDEELKDKLEEITAPLFREAHKLLTFQLKLGIRQLQMLHDTKKRPSTENG